MSCIMSDELKTLSRRISGLEKRLDEIMESPDPAETRAGGLRDRAIIYRCNACDPGDGLPPCVCLLSQNLGRPTECLYAPRQAKEVPAGWTVVDQDLGALVLDGIFAGVHE